jgi:hypothetical protein
VVRALGPTAGGLQSFSRSLAPVAKLLDQNIAQILDVLQGWGRAIGDRDGIGHIYRIEGLVPNNVITSLFGQSAATPSARPRRRVARHRMPRPTPAIAAPAPAHHGNPPLPQLPHLPPLPGVAPAKPPTGGTVSSLLNYLLGR